jgi:hypothetical protein
MATNIGVEGLIGVIPFAGDVFDAAWKANQRNVRLLDAWLDRAERTERSSRLISVALALGLGALLVLLGMGGFYLLRWAIGAL